MPQNKCSHVTTRIFLIHFHQRHGAMQRHFPLRPPNCMAQQHEPRVSHAPCSAAQEQLPVPLPGRKQGRKEGSKPARQQTSKHAINQSFDHSINQLKQTTRLSNNWIEFSLPRRCGTVMECFLSAKWQMNLGRSWKNHQRRIKDMCCKPL